RFGRAWRRKAPVESLMPLRLARYGVPLSETAPAGLAAAGIGSGADTGAAAGVGTGAGADAGSGAEGPVRVPPERAADERAAFLLPRAVLPASLTEAVRRGRRGEGDLRLAPPEPPAVPEPDEEEPAEPESPLRPGETAEAAAERFADAYHAFVAQFGVAPTTAQWAFWLHDTYGLSTTEGKPFPDAPLGPVLQVLRQRHGGSADPAPTASPAPAEAAR
ncbi:hypothetical protein ACF09N_36985, partial [Streptomyces sp. NPDC014777]